MVVLVVLLEFDGGVGRRVGVFVAHGEQAMCFWAARHKQKRGILILTRPRQTPQTEPEEGTSSSTTKADQSE